MKSKIVNLLKYNKTVYKIYYYLMTACLALMKLFVKTDEKLILFNSFAGRKYDDSPKAIFEAMRADPRFTDYKFVWAFHEPEKFEVDGAEKIKTDGLKYFKTALAARAWVTNSSVERGLRFKKKNTFFLNTWHGSPIKKMGSDIASDNQSFSSKGKNHTDVMNTQSYFEADIFSKCFDIPRNHFIEVGLPRNDTLANYTEEERATLRRKLGLPEDKIVILYCPTFREYEKDENLGVVLAPPMDLKKWEAELGDQYVLLFRAHYEVSKVMVINENVFVRNVTDYPALNDLMVASDILISDYSSIFFDYSIMDKVMLHFTYDFDKYEEKRGMYFDIRDYLSGSASEDGVIVILKELDYKKETEKTVTFRNKYMNFYGEASKKTVDCIAEHIM
ncbi:MAG: CDP-glycerol--poly(glycerophosphate) glycerophosphotransferase [Spirochaetales bacterium]|nr:CDP-glycerol--poly(glycerophosphate) glycerophosphotransferase [Spirochaetales bacterium]